jgi:uncharacterized membrane protein YdjX (TVP38/TMEM64 family)
VADSGLLLLIAGFIFGVTTMGFLLGYGYCGSCWLAFFYGRRYKEECQECILATYNQHTTLMEENKQGDPEDG